MTLPFRITDLTAPSYRILIIGGGPAGSAGALRLRQHQLEVHVVEKAELPRPKVCGCCLGPGGLHALQLLGLRQRIASAGLQLHRWLGALEKRLIRVELPAGLAISRERLDWEMLSAAQRHGAKVQQACQGRIQHEDADGVTVELRDRQGSRTESFSHVIVAGGLNVGGVQEVLPWTDPPQGPFGVSFTLPDGVEVPQGTIAMACADDGYVGMVRLEDGRLNVAAALRRPRRSGSNGKPIQRVADIVSASPLGPMPLQEASAVLTTPPLRRCRLAGRRRVLAVGDAAGYVEPFTGEGMTWAMQSAVAAADVIATAGGDPSTAGDRWRRESQRLLGQRKRHCRWLTGALRSKTVRHVSGLLLSRFPSLGQPIVRSLSGPTPRGFDVTFSREVG